MLKDDVKELNKNVEVKFVNSEDEIIEYVKQLS